MPQPNTYSVKVSVDLLPLEESLSKDYEKLVIRPVLTYPDLVISNFEFNNPYVKMSIVNPRDRSLTIFRESIDRMLRNKVTDFEFTVVFEGCELEQPISYVQYNLF